MDGAGAIENFRLNPLIDNIEEAGTISYKAWPNPGSGIINVDLPDDRVYSYSVYNTSGICLRKGTMGSATGNSLDLSGYPSGLYFIVINDGKSNFVLRYSLIR
ncbi:MAG TPA: T9SS type A sorting domain-containing protein [Bacteroidales bacterium]|nr:T9SS type A sorting domain-containing protein [Bacteroidales bacterium]